MARKQKRAAQLTLRPADPFELIRWLARSQGDPRKAVAELVQNSLDAGASHVEVHRRRVRRELCLVVRDDGEGVLPELDREAALRHLATHVGHSGKLGLDPAERARRVVAGKYGVGLLGFWSIGRSLELRTRVAGSRLLALRLEEDSPRAEIVDLPLPTDAPETYTEVAVVGVHDAAKRALGGRRLCDYLAAELRGQLLAREVRLLVHDRIARGLAQKRFEVTPRRFQGERLELPDAIPVPSFEPIRVELYLAVGEPPAIQVACAGTLVADDLAELRALGLDTPPWTGRGVSGVLDFPSFNVPPGTRRGVAPDRAAAAFVTAMGELEPLVTAELDRLEGERRAARDRDVAQELRRALRGLRRRLPHYDLPIVDGGGHDEGGGAGERLRGGESPGASGPRPKDLDLFPPGPLERVRVAPAEVTIAPGAERRVRAVATDRDGRPADGVSFAWRVDDPEGLGVEIDGAGPRPAVRVRADARLAGTAALVVEARQDGRSVDARATLRVVEPTEDGAGSGIPEPILVDDPAGLWRSRMTADGRWEVNEAHEDYRSLRAEPRARVRYLLSLLAREMVVRTTGRPELGAPLDAMIEILAHAERNLRGR